MLDISIAMYAIVAIARLKRELLCSIVLPQHPLPKFHISLTYFAYHMSLNFCVMFALSITIDQCMALWGEPT